MRRDFLIRLLCFFWFFLGGFVVLVRLAITESTLWLVALTFLVVHQIATAATMRYILWEMKPVPFGVLAAGVFVFIQGGVLETIAVYAVGALFVLSTLATWFMTSSSWMQERYRFEQRIRQAPKF